MDNEIIDSESSEDVIFENEDTGEDNEDIGDNRDVEIPPFDPTQINIITKQDTLVNIIQRLENDEINLAPPYQREADLWKSLQQSRLIESILIRIPLPAFYFDCTNENKWEIVDGLQRLSTIKNFVIGQTFALTGLEYLSSLRGKRYDALERQYKRRINECPITYFQITPGTPEEVKYSIFRRINTGGLSLNEQEIRNAMATPHARDFLQSLSKNEYFSMILSCSEEMRKRKKDHELILRFLAFYHIDVLKKSFTNIAELLNSMQTTLNHSTIEQREQWQAAYERAMMRSYHLFGKQAFEKSSTRRVRKNTPLYEVWTVCLARLSEAQWLSILPHREEIKHTHQEYLESDKDYIWSISYATQKREHIMNRYNIVNEIIKQYDSEN